jgi:hypothetical protein
VDTPTVADAAASAEAAPKAEPLPGPTLPAEPPLAPLDSPSHPPTTSDAPSAVATAMPDRDRSEATGRRRAAVRRLTGPAMLMRRYRGTPPRPSPSEVTMIEFAWNLCRRPDGNVYEIIGPDRSRE